MNRNIKILIVEDNQGITQALNEVLSDIGFEIETARHGKEALDKIINHELPHLILLDLFLPVMGGLELRDRLHEMPSYAQIPIIGMSADAFVKRRCEGHHIELYLKKPFELNDLLVKIEKALEKHHPISGIQRTQG